MNKNLPKIFFMFNLCNNKSRGVFQGFFQKRPGFSLDYFAQNSSMSLSASSISGIG